MLTVTCPTSSSSPELVHAIDMDLAGLLVNVESVAKYMSMCNLTPEDRTIFSVPQCCNPDCDKYGQYHNMEYGTIMRFVDRDCGFVCDQCRPHRAILWAQRYQMNLQGTWPPPVKVKVQPKSHYRQMRSAVRQQPELLKELGKIIQAENYNGKKAKEQFYELLRSRGIILLGESKKKAKKDEFYDFTRALGIKLNKRQLPEACQPERLRPTANDIEYWKKCVTGQHNILQFMIREDAKLNEQYPEIKDAIRQQQIMIDLTEKTLAVFK